MPKETYDVDHSADEQGELESFVSRGTRSAQAILRARILLKVDESATDTEIIDWLDCSEMTVYRARNRYAEDGIDLIHRDKPDREYERKLDGETGGPTDRPRLQRPAGGSDQLDAWTVGRRTHGARSG